MATKCFMIAPIAKQYQWLRRFKYGGATKCADGQIGHDAWARILDFASPVPAIGQYESGDRSPFLFAGDSRWPVKCASCAYEFVDADARQVSNLRVYADADGREFCLPGHIFHDVPVAPAGAMYWSWWSHGSHFCFFWDNCQDPRGHLNVVCPGGRIWDIDSRASNCKWKEDRSHRCWIKHGEAPMLTVDKAGKTCAAGAGSIVAGSYHGFLQNGALT